MMLIIHPILVRFEITKPLNKIMHAIMQIILPMNSRAGRKRLKQGFLLNTTHIAIFLGDRYCILTIKKIKYSTEDQFRYLGLRDNLDKAF